MSLLVTLLIWVIQLFVLLVFIRVILSWISPFPTNSFTRFFWLVTEPVLAPIRRSLPLMSGIDLSPLVVWVVSLVLIAVLRGFAA
jgi:YggT family protein